MKKILFSAVMLMTISAVTFAQEKPAKKEKPKTTQSDSTAKKAPKAEAKPVEKKKAPATKN